MFEMRIVLVLIALLVAASLGIYKVQTEKTMGQQSKNKTESPCETEYKCYCLNTIAIIFWMRIV